jgi:hypothetical protein
MLSNAGYTGFHLGYGKNWTLDYDPVLVYKKNPYIPILEMPAPAFYTLSDEQLLKTIKAAVVSSYEHDLDKAKADLETLKEMKAVVDRDFTNRFPRYEANAAIAKAKNKIKKLTKELDFYKNL